MTTLDVFWESVLVGSLSQAEGRGMSFRYAASYLASETARSISLSLPLQAEAFGGDRTGPWFENLLPEGEIRGHVARVLRVSARNEFALLNRIGGDCAGALQLIPRGTPDEQRGAPIPLSWDELERTIAAAPRPSLMALVMQQGDVRLSLAGAQDKLPVCWSGDELALPGGDRASTHLIKISSGIFPDLVPNELFCMRLAAAVGLTVARVAPAPTATPILLVERYDRLRDPRGAVIRLHQEDLCQALGSPPDAKYESEGGPSLADLFDALRRGSRNPLPDKRALLTWVVFNYLIGNADAHAKNASLLIGRLGDRTGPRLAPFYDLVCTEAYEHLSGRFAQKIGGEYRLRSVARRHWDCFAESIGVKPNYLAGLGLELCDRIDAAAAPLADSLRGGYPGTPTLDAILKVITRQTGRLRTAMGR